MSTNFPMSMEDVEALGALFDPKGRATDVQIRRLVAKSQEARAWRAKFPTPARAGADQPKEPA